MGPLAAATAGGHGVPAPWWGVGIGLIVIGLLPLAVGRPHSGERGRQRIEAGLAGLRHAVEPGERLEFALYVPWAHGRGIRRLGLMGTGARMPNMFFVGLTTQRLLVYQPNTRALPGPYQVLDRMVPLARASIRVSRKKDSNLWLNAFWHLDLIALDTPLGTMHLGSRDPQLQALRDTLAAGAGSRGAAGE